MKKTYCKPEMKTRRLELGVFGDYGRLWGDDYKPKGSLPPAVSILSLGVDLA